MEMLASILPWIQVGLSVVLIALVLIQQNEASLGSAFGGASASFAHTKRGLERTIFIATIIVAILFIVSAIVALFL